jgi:hypothetical protein
MDTVAILIVIVVFILVFIAYAYGEKLIAKDALENLKVGYQFTLYEDNRNPFALHVTIVEIKSNRYKQPYVKYEFPDGTTNTTSYVYFCNRYDVFNPKNKGES